ncbi:hypothetical protein CHUAL_013722 [Chamberlinius hualienensis]
MKVTLTLCYKPPVIKEEIRTFFIPILTTDQLRGRLDDIYDDNKFGKKHQGVDIDDEADSEFKQRQPVWVNPEFDVDTDNRPVFRYERRFKRSLNLLPREKRQIPVNNPALNSAVGNSLTNKPPGVPQFSYDVAGAGNSARNFDAAGSIGAGVKVFDHGRSSLGLGVGASGNLARVDGRTSSGSPQVGIGAGYQHDRISVGLGVGRTLGRSPSNQFGASFGYRFRRDISKHTVEEDDDDQPLY